MSAELLNIATDAQAASCPRCNAHLLLHRSSLPFIDECGFESYDFECTECGAALSGIVDPYDDALLLAEIAA